MAEPLNRDETEDVLVDGDAGEGVAVGDAVGGRSVSDAAEAERSGESVGVVEPALGSGKMSSRVASVDALRGLTILLMIFVNDVAAFGSARLPHWLDHANLWADADAATGRIDAMSLPDVVFPAFLFIAGVSIPLAFWAARRRGATWLSLLLKVLGRTGALVLMGFLMVNQETHDPWPGYLWGIALYVCFLLAFSVLPRERGGLRTSLWWGRWVGAAGLAALAFVYRDAEGHMIVLGPLFGDEEGYWLQHHWWWGILGLIGWAYFAAALVYLLVGARREWLVGGVAVMSVMYLGVSAGIWDRFESRGWMEGVLPFLRPVGDVFGFINSNVGFRSTLGSGAAITMAGVVLGTVLVPGSGVEGHWARVRWGMGFALLLFLLALMFDPVTGIDKVAATPAWCLLCAAIACAAWVVLYVVMDVMRFTAWAWPIKPAGENPLLAYLLHPFLIWVVMLVGLNPRFYHGEDWPLWAAVVGSLVMSFFVVLLTGLIARLGIRLKV